MAVAQLGADEAAEVAIPYLAAIAARWPDRERVARRPWLLARAQGAPCAQWQLVRAAHVYQGAVTKWAHDEAVTAEEITPEALDGVTWLLARTSDGVIGLWDSLPASITGLDLGQYNHQPAVVRRSWWGQLRALRIGARSLGSHEPQNTNSALRSMMCDEVALGHIEELILCEDRLAVEPLRWAIEQTSLKALTLEDAQTISDEVALALATAPELRGLRSLRLEGVQMSGHALWAIGSSETLAGLERLELDNKSKPRWELEGRALLRDVRLVGLRSLMMKGCGLRSDCIKALVRRAPELTQLKHIDVSHNPRLWASEVNALRTAYPAAEVLGEGDQSAVKISGEEVSLDTQSLGKVVPRVFHKAFEERPPKDWTYIRAALDRGVYVEPLLAGRFERLRELSLTGGYQTAPETIWGLPRMLASGQLPALEKLSLWELPLSIRSGSWPAGLREVALVRCRLDDRDAARLCEALPASLERLDLSHNYLTVESVEALRAALPDTELDVTGNLCVRITAGGALRLGPDDVYDEREARAQHRSAAWAMLKRVEIEFIDKMYGDDWPVSHCVEFVGAHPHLKALDALCIDGSRADILDHDHWLDRALSNLPERLRSLELPHGLRSHRSDAMRLARRLKHEALEVLDLRHNGLADASVVEALAQNEALPCLREVWLREGNRFGEAELARFATLRRWEVR
jgi:hypothetical protein